MSEPPSDKATMNDPVKTNPTMIDQITSDKGMDPPGAAPDAPAAQIRLEAALGSLDLTTTDRVTSDKSIDSPGPAADAPSAEMRLETALGSLGIQTTEDSRIEKSSADKQVPETRTINRRAASTDDMQQTFDHIDASASSAPPIGGIESDNGKSGTARAPSHHSTGADTGSPPLRDRYRSGRDRPYFRVLVGAGNRMQQRLEQGRPMDEAIAAGRYIEVHPSLCREDEIVVFVDASHDSMQSDSERAGLGIAYHMNGVWTHHAMRIPMPRGMDRAGTTRWLELKAAELAAMLIKRLIERMHAGGYTGEIQVFLYTDCRHNIEMMAELYDPTWRPARSTQSSTQQETGSTQSESEQETQPALVYTFDFDRVPQWPESDEIFSSCPDDFRRDGTLDRRSVLVADRLFSIFNYLHREHGVRARYAHVPAHAGIEGNERADRSASFARLLQRPEGRDPRWTFWSTQERVDGSNVNSPLLSNAVWTMLEPGRPIPLEIDPYRQGATTLRTPALPTFNRPVAQQPDR